MTNRIISNSIGLVIWMFTSTKIFLRLAAGAAVMSLIIASLYAVFI